MKRIASILLLCVLLFNWFGYRIVSSYLEQQANVALETQLDQNEYDESQLIEIKVPIRFPYLADSRDFERYDGEIEIDGIHYKYVKRKVSNDSLILLCLPNETKMKLQSVRDEFFLSANDLQHEQQNSKKADFSFKQCTAEYFAEKNNWTINTSIVESFQFFTTNNRFQSSGFMLIPEQPPKV